MTRFFCNYEDCGKSYAREYNLNIHIKRYHEKTLEIKKIPCSYDNCKRIYTTNSNLNQHIKEKHKFMEPLKCSYEGCKYTTKSKSSVKQHINSVHLKKNLKKCPYNMCKYETPLTSNLNSHINRVHKKIKKVKCDICEKEFYSKHHLERHSVVHEKIYKYFCDYDDCVFKTVSQDYLNTHIKGMHKKTIYKCQNQKCDYSTSHKSGLHVHKKCCKNGETGSSGEIAIKKILRSLNYVENESYYYNKTYNKLTKETSRKLRFDFIILHNDITKFIEYDGRQHYFPVCWSKSKEKSIKSFEETKERDKLKTDFCKKHNLKLLRIPYWDKNIIPEIIKNFLND